MRYTDTSMSFWIIVKKLFKGKGINFFRGYKSDNLHDTSISPKVCRVNFIVLSDPILSKESAKYRLDAIKPGVKHVQCVSIILKTLKVKGGHSVINNNNNYFFIVPIL